MLKPILIFPKLEDAPAQAVSESALARPAFASDGGEKRRRLWQPAAGVAAAQVLDEFGFKASSAHDDVSFGPGHKGVAQHLSLFSADIAMAPEVHAVETVDALRERLGASYHVVSDFEVSLAHDAESPKQAQLNSQFHTRHPASGVKAARHKSRRVRGAGVICAFVDTGADVDHLELISAARKQTPVRFGYFTPIDRVLSDARGFDPDGHGTHVAAIVGGKRGVAPDTTLVMAGFAKASEQSASLRVIMQALNWLFETFDDAGNRDSPVILNLSLGVEYPGERATQTEVDNFQAFRSIIQATVGFGVLVVASIGNDGRGRFRAPASEPGVLAVGSVDNALGVSPFSGHVPARQVGPHGPSRPDVMGFGEEVVSARPRNRFGHSVAQTRSGTSQAAAYVSGIASLYWSEDRRAHAKDVIDVIKATAQPIGNRQPRESVRTGAGLARWAPDMMGGRKQKKMPSAKDAETAS